MTTKLLLCALALMLASGLGAVWAQQTPQTAAYADVRVVERRSDGLRIEVTAVWPVPLRAAVDSAQNALPAKIARIVAAGMPPVVSETVTLPARRLPTVRVVAADADEVTLTAGADTSGVARWSGPVVAASGLGTERRQPVANVEARLLTYDTSSRTLRRYRRLVLEVNYGTVPTASARAFGAGRPASNPHLAVEESVLAGGTVFRFSITEEGLYRIDRDVLSNLGLSPGEIEPNQLKVYGNGGAPLPALNSAPRPVDLIENPVYVRGGGDGSFDEDDVLLFWANGPRGWRYDSEQAAWTHYVHPFSNQNVYFLKVDGAGGQRVGEGTFPGYADATDLREVTGRYVVDFDETMWSKEHGSGQTWVSRRIRGGERLDVLDGVMLPGQAAGEVLYETRVAIRSVSISPAAAVQFLSGNAVLAEVSAGNVSSRVDAPIAADRVASFTEAVPAGATFNLAMLLPGRSNQPEAALDWLRVFYPKALRAENGLLRFATPGGQAGRFEMTLSGFSAEPQVWDVTEPGQIRRLGVQGDGGTWQIQVQATDAPREIVAFVEGEAAQALDATSARRVPPQNLHGIQDFPELVIVTPDTLREQADDLAAYRQGQGLNTLVTDVEAIYNEFSGGVPDMRAVRDYFKFLYDRDGGETSAFRYALLFGDGHYDFRGLGAEDGDERGLENWIFPYETEETFSPVRSYTSDDYFGLLDDDEGVWTYTNSGTAERVDIGIGRLTVQTPSQAAAVVDKIKHYEAAVTYGPWRTRYTAIADDGPSGLGATSDDLDLHVQNADFVAELVKREAPPMNVQKVYGPSYQREYVGAWRLPGAKEDLLEAIREGTLVFNYSGHGGVEGLTQEEIFTRTDVLNLDNYDKLPVFVTATCSFGRWDMAEMQSAGEEVLLNPDGGGVALMTTVRLVYTSNDTTSLNPGLNRQINLNLFERDQDGRPPRLGDVLRRTKNTAAGLQTNNRKFNLLGDPAMRIGLPEGQAAIRTVNGMPVDSAAAPLRALDQITVAGEIRTSGGQLDAGFNGVVALTVFDALRQVTLPYHRFMPTPYYLVREDLIWRGEVEAQNGLFEATFVVPKDISYAGRPGRIAAYAYSGTGDRYGFTENVVVGGTVPDLPDDQAGPEVALFLGDTTFVSGGIVPPEPELIVQLFDASGINTAGAGVGHETLLVVDGEERSAIDLGDRFRSVGDSYRRGRIDVALPPQPPGPHTLTVKAWDVVNNSTEASLDYIVAASERLELRNVYNYPNPMHEHTRFVFDHNQAPGTPAEVNIRIYTLTGRPVRTFDEVEALPSGLLNGGPVQAVTWDGRDDDGERLASGVYLYKVRVEVERDDGEREVAERVEKIALIR